MNDLHDRLVQLQTDALTRLEEATDVDAVEALRSSLVGRSGELTGLLKRLGEVEPGERPAVGLLANTVRSAVEEAIRSRLDALAAGREEARLTGETIDISAPGRAWRIGHLHPTMTVERDLREIFHAFGFEVFEGPEIETDAMNFEALNIPPITRRATCGTPSSSPSLGSSLHAPRPTARSCARTPARSRSAPCARCDRRSG